MSPTPLHQHHKPDPLIQGRMDPFLLFTPNPDPANQMSQHKSRLIRPGDVFIILQTPCKLQLPLLFLGSSGTWCGLLLLPIIFKALIYCVFSYALLHILLVRSWYLSYCCFPIKSKQSG